jgi:hypothetical protein
MDAALTVTRICWFMSTLKMEALIELSSVSTLLRIPVTFKIASVSSLLRKALLHQLSRISFSPFCHHL